jgi:hypothetical protein
MKGNSEQDNPSLGIRVFTVGVVAFFLFIVISGRWFNLAEDLIRGTIIGWAFFAVGVFVLLIMWIAELDYKWIILMEGVVVTLFIPILIPIVFIILDTYIYSFDFIIGGYMSVLILAIIVVVWVVTVYRLKMSNNLDDQVS